MKKIFCTWGFSIALLLSSAQVLFCQTVSGTDAKTVAINFMKAENPQAQILTSRDQTTGVENQDGALVYVFNFQPGGFVLVAGDMKSMPILGFSENNHFDLQHLNPEAGFYLNEMESQISALKATKNIQPMLSTWDKFLKDKVVYGAESETIVGPYLTTQWNQGQYYNQMCPADNMGPAGHALTGCVATAMAQVIKYHNSPAYGMGDHGYQHAKYGWLEADFENTPYNWNNMPNQLSANNSDVATLIYHCGVAVDMDYGPSSSGAFMSNVAPALQNHFRFSSTMTTVQYAASPLNFLTTVSTDLNSGRPVLMSGHTAQDGHAWVCDGYKLITGFSMYYHMNWGWGGSSNGYFQMGNFNGFNSGIEAITGIEPVCPLTADLTNTLAASIPVEVTQTITSCAPVIPYIPALGNHVDYDAGKSIQMNPGFIADGSIVVFTAFIQGCGGHTPFTQGGSGERTEAGSSVANPTQTSADLNAYPNPFTSSTTIAYTLPMDQDVDVQIFNAVGNLVAQPVRQEQQTAGLHEYNFEENSLSSGVYFLVMQTGGQKMTKRLVLAR